MKKYKSFFIIISIIFVIALLLTLWIRIRYWDILLYCMLYNSIEYNGVTYYMVDDQGNHPSNNYSDEEIVVYLVDSKGRVSYKHPYYAKGYIGDEERKYLFFDSALFTRIDNLTPEDIKSSNIKSKDVEDAIKTLKKTPEEKSAD